MNAVMPMVMGVVNVTPDSFSDGGRFLDPEAAIAHGRRLRAEGADIVDVGGESSRPGAERVPVELELARVLPVVEALAVEGRVSIDTVKPDVARAAVAAGATLINDISGGLHPVAAEAGVGWVAMHMQGTPATMQADPTYHDVVVEVRDWLVAKAEAALADGVPEVWIDPGIGFGKTVDHNLALIAAIAQLVETGYPVLIGASRKSFLATIVSRSGEHGAAAAAQSPDPEDRLDGSLSIATWAMSEGARMVRVHDVAATVHAARVVAA